jgi:hypothetical protein
VRSTAEQVDLDQVDLAACDLSLLVQVLFAPRIAGRLVGRAEHLERGDRLVLAPHRFYLIGIGKDQYVASNDTAAGRKENRRVEVQLLSNMGVDSASGSQQAAPTGQANPPQQATTTVPE